MPAQDYLSKSTEPCIILAGAGTGKTHALVEKIKHLINESIYKPEEIVCLTFSNEATRSMETRIALSLPEDGQKPLVRTFHAICSDILKKHGVTEFRIIEPDDIKIMLHKNLKIPARVCEEYSSAIGKAKDLGIDISEYDSFIEQESKSYPENMAAEIESLQFQLRTLYARKSQKETHLVSQKLGNLESFMKKKKFINAWKAYEKLKIKKGLLDYSDLNVQALQILKKKPSISEEWKYIMVDEFQDTNKIQLDILSLLAPHRNVTIVGDINQSIYRFRGAYKDNIVLFRKMFNVKTENIYALDKSRRSPNTILRIAHKIISNNYANKDECIVLKNSEEREGQKVQAWELKNSNEEVRKIGEIIQQEITKVKPEEICVMFRTHQQANLLKKFLDKSSIPYSSVSKKPLLKNNAIKTIESYLSIVNSIKKSPEKAQVGDWWNLIHSTLEKEDALSLSEYMKKNRDSKNLANELFSASVLDKTNISDNGKILYSSLITKIKSLISKSDNPLPSILSDAFLMLNLENLEKTKEGRETLLSLGEFKKLAETNYNKEFFDLDGFLYHLNIIKSLDINLEAPRIDNGGIRIMTAHSTKGLEYPVVIVANMVQKKFPIEKTTTDKIIPPELLPQIKDEIKNLDSFLKEEAIEEYERRNQIMDERRLCYVAFTRAKERLYITYAKEYGGKTFSPSQFLLEANYKESPDIEYVVDNEEKHNMFTSDIPVISTQSPEKISFSPSSLCEFAKCQKKYEYKFVLNMPDPESQSIESMNLGSFVHQVIEQGVKEGFANERSFILYAKEESLKPEWQKVDLNEALTLIRVFYERNKNKYNEKSRTEEWLSITLEGMKFKGRADRIDFHEDGVEIIDYKTGKSTVQPRERNWQLGLYALASQKFGRVKRVTLEMLKQDRPLEFDINDKGIAVERNTKRMSFSLQDVKKEIIETAKQILECYRKGFQPCSIEKNCSFCEEFVWSK